MSDLLIYNRPRMLDDRVREYIFPVRVVWASDSGIQGHLELTRQECASFLVQRERGGDPPGILLDFGVELHGGIRIQCSHNSTHKPVRFRVRFGESVSEAMGEPDNDHAVHDQEILVPWNGYTEIGNTGFRFVRLDLLDENVDVKLASVQAVALYRQLPYRGSFECSDERLNEIWKVGARTVHLCLQDHLWDGIKRDRLVWAGDIHPEVRVVNAVFGQIEVVENTLDYLRDQWPLPGWMNGISSYSIWWIITHQDWFKCHGDFRYLRQQKGYLLGLLDRLFGCVNDDGSENLDGHRFIDWSTADDSDAISSGLQALLVCGFKSGAALCSVLGEDAVAAKAERYARKTESVVNDFSMRKQCQALSVLAGTANAVDANISIFSNESCADISPFFGYYVLEARAKAGDYIGCLNFIRSYWGPMLDLGATTFWEHFDPAWAQNAGRINELPCLGQNDVHRDFGEHCYKGLRNSFCHGWSAGPTAWLSEQVLGVTPMVPGFRVANINPNLGDLKWARGTVPTPLGDIYVSHEMMADGSVRSEVKAHDDIRIVESNHSKDFVVTTL